ncbi:glycosyltransferase family 2 protein [Roseomonas alkaliterrae]|uniref:Glycosyltransferase involved in cell wall biosynthesis n=1 Tax=Neoroseomonas alkaliterrae TaxID=1452450 RepID=A0A840Y6I9_9PROT|nr:glycosyltransferase involved in cell wall biosynthesis [Neoroseomonas alkaliterrae]MBR0674800.1 glycosyltransferase family 2 protein [Neoroseomonas alkaliterrae]
MRFSLIVATLGRDRDVAALLDSLLAQGRSDLEVIIVDQNEDDRLGPIEAAYAPRLPLRRLRSSIRNANNARNLGLRHARGAIVTFPDDDCLYPPGVLDRVDAAFATDPSLQVLTGPAASPEGGLGSGRWRQESGPIDLATVWTSVIEFNIFLRREAALALGGFDEGMGPGSPFGSAEGNDLVCRAIARGWRAQYDRDLRIIHPDKSLSDVAVERAERYGRGLGLALRRNGAPARMCLTFLVRPLGGVAVSLLRGRMHDAGYYWMTFRGRLAGMMAPEARRAPSLPPLTESA